MYKTYNLFTLFMNHFVVANLHVRRTQPNYFTDAVRKVRGVSAVLAMWAGKTHI